MREVHGQADVELRVLRTLRLLGFAPHEVVAERIGCPPGEALTVLSELGETGHVLLRSGRVGGWTLSTEGRQRLAVLSEQELDAGGGRATVDGVYVRFLRLNARFLSLCTDWQLRPGDAQGEPVVNDHSDAAYDDTVIRRLVELDAAIRPVLAHAASAVVRFGAYPPRLSDALERVRVGDLDWFTRPVIDSYHTVWFELHEDLLATLGLERSSER